MNSILVIGSVALDTVLTPSGTQRDVLGGSATYFALSASFFSRVNLVATVGRDFPKKYTSLIKSFGVDLRGLEVREGKTFRWKGSYLDDLNCARTIDTQLNVFADFSPRIPREYKNSRYIFLANIDPDLQLSILKGSRHCQFAACDSMNHWIQNKGPVLKRLIKMTSAVFLNEAEAMLLSGESNILRTGKYMLSLGPRFAIVKRGEYGAVLFYKDRILFMAPAYPIEKVCDPTGAGDTFAGGFMGYLTKIKKIDSRAARKALLYGSTMASFAVEGFSVNRLRRLKMGDIEARCRSFIRLTMV